MASTAPSTDRRTTTSALAAAALATVLVGAPGAAHADGELLERAHDALSDVPPSVGGIEAPRVTRTDLPPGISTATLPGYRSDASQLDYRWWASKGRASVGLGLGTVVEAQRPLAAATHSTWNDDAVTAHATATIMTLGLRYRTTEHSAFYADASGVRGMPGVNDDKALVGKVGVEFKAAKSRWNVAYGGLGLHLNGDTRMTLRVRRGGVAVYMRSKF